MSATCILTGLHRGNGDGLFGASQSCTRQMYDTFMLRVLGYKDNSDFTFDNASAFASSLGLSDYPQTPDFTRKDMVATTFLTLLAQPKAGNSLISSYADENNQGALAVQTRQRLFKEMAGKETNFSSFYEQGFAAKATWTYTLQLNNVTLVWKKVTDFATQPTEKGLRCRILITEDAQFFDIVRKTAVCCGWIKTRGWSGKQVYSLSDDQYNQQLKSAFSQADAAFSLDLSKTAPFALVSGMTNGADGLLMTIDGIVPDLGKQQWNSIFSLDPSQWTSTVGKVSERVIPDEKGQVSVVRVFFPVTICAGAESYTLTVEREIDVLGRGAQVQLTPAGCVYRPIAAKNKSFDATFLVAKK